MIEKAAVLGGQRRLDHVVGNFFERHRVVAQEAALADLVAVAVEEGDAELVREVDLALGDLEGGQREGKNHEQAGDAQGQTVANEFVAGPPEAFDLETAEEGRVGPPPIPKARQPRIEARIDPGIDLQPIDQLAAIIALHIPQRTWTSSRIAIRPRKNWPPQQRRTPVISIQRIRPFIEVWRDAEQKKTA